MGKIYTLVKFEMSVSKGITLDLEPIPGLFLWHEKENEHDLYCLMFDSGFMYTLNEAKERALVSLNTTLFARKNALNTAIIEVECDNERITKFNKLFTYKNNNWNESEIKEKDLTGFAYPEINATYRKKGYSLMN